MLNIDEVLFLNREKWQGSLGLDYFFLEIESSEEVKEMLFMEIVTWKPDKRDEVERRAAEWKCPEGITERGYWVDLTGRRVFYLYETDDPKAILEASHYWTDIVKIDTFQVMEAKEAMELMQNK